MGTVPGSVNVARRGILKAIGLLPVLLKNPWELVDPPTEEEPIPVLRKPSKIWTPSDAPFRIGAPGGRFMLQMGEGVEVSFEGIVTSWTMTDDTRRIPYPEDATGQPIAPGYMSELSGYRGSLEFVTAGPVDFQR